MASLEARCPNEINEEDLALWKSFGRQTGIRLLTVVPLLFWDEQFEFGSLSNPIPAARRKAVERTKAALRLNRELKTDFAVVWPGIDINPERMPVETAMQINFDALRAANDRLNGLDRELSLYAANNPRPCPCPRLAGGLPRPRPRPAGHAAVAAAACRRKEAVSARFLLGIDLGTGGAGAVHLDASGRVEAGATAGCPLYTPRPLWAEQEPRDWWWTAVRAIRVIGRTRPAHRAGVQFQEQAAEQMLDLVFVGDQHIAMPAVAAGVVAGDQPLLHVLPADVAVHAICPCAEPASSADLIAASMILSLSCRKHISAFAPSSSSLSRAPSLSWIW